MTQIWTVVELLCTEGQKKKPSISGLSRTRENGTLPWEVCTAWKSESVWDSGADLVSWMVMLEIFMHMWFITVVLAFNWQLSRRKAYFMTWGGGVMTGMKGLCFRRAYSKISNTMPSGWSSSCFWRPFGKSCKYKSDIMVEFGEVNLTPENATKVKSKTEHIPMSDCILINYPTRHSTPSSGYM